MTLRTKKHDRWYQNGAEAMARPHHPRRVFAQALVELARVEGGEPNGAWSSGPRIDPKLLQDQDKPDPAEEVPCADAGRPGAVQTMLRSRLHVGESMGTEELSIVGLIGQAVRDSCRRLRADESLQPGGARYR